MRKYLEGKLKNLREGVKQNKGFSLMELIVVMAIISILAVMAMPDLQNTLFSTRITACESDIKTIGDAVMKYYAETGKLPDVSSIEELKTELTREDFEIGGRKYGPWMKENMNTTDPWGNTFEYKYDGGKKYDICSAGDPESPREICYRTLGRDATKKS